MANVTVVICGDYTQIYVAGWDSPGACCAHVGSTLRGLGYSCEEKHLPPQWANRQRDPGTPLFPERFSDIPAGDFITPEEHEKLMTQEAAG